MRGAGIDVGVCQGFNVKSSTDPGRFVCNWIYYISLRWAKGASTNQDGSPCEDSLFVHVFPPLPLPIFLSLIDALTHLQTTDCGTLSPDSRLWGAGAPLLRSPAGEADGVLPCAPLLSRRVHVHMMELPRLRSASSWRNSLACCLLSSLRERQQILELLRGRQNVVVQQFEHELDWNLEPSASLRQHSIADPHYPTHRTDRRANELSKGT